MSKTKRNRTIPNKLKDFFDVELNSDRGVTKYKSIVRKLSMKSYTIGEYQQKYLNNCTNKLVFKNANRSFKKTVRQQSKREICHELLK